MQRLAIVDGDLMDLSGYKCNIEDKLGKEEVFEDVLIRLIGAFVIRRDPPRIANFKCRSFTSTTISPDLFCDKSSRYSMYILVFGYSSLFLRMPQKIKSYVNSYQLSKRSHE